MAELQAILDKYTAPLTGGIHGASFVAIDINVGIEWAYVRFIRYWELRRNLGNDIYRGAHGSRTVDHHQGQPLTTDTLTWIASQTKLTAAVSVLQIVERGLIGLDDDVREVIAELKDLQVLLGFEGEDESTALASVFDNLSKGGEGGHTITGKPQGSPIFEELDRPLTLRQLLSHSSGFAYDLAHPSLLKYSAWANRKENMFSGTIQGQTHPLVFQPGTSWIYGPGLDWAGRVIEVLTDQDLDTWQQANIWGPLGAEKTTFRPSKHFSQSEMQETGYRDAPGAQLKLGPSVWPWAARDALGGGGLYSTVNDYSKLLSVLLRGGGSILKPSSVDMLFSPVLGAESMKALRAFGIGDSPATSETSLFVNDPAQWRHVQDLQYTVAGIITTEDIEGRRKKGTVSWSGLPNLAWWIDRETGVAAVLFTQIMPFGDGVARSLLIELERAVYKCVDKK